MSKCFWYFNHQHHLHLHDYCHCHCHCHCQSSPLAQDGIRTHTLTTGGKRGADSAGKSELEICFPQDPIVSVFCRIKDCNCQPHAWVCPMVERPMWPCHSVYRETSRAERTTSHLDFLTAAATISNTHQTPLATRHLRHASWCLVSASWCLVSATREVSGSSMQAHMRKE